MKKIYITPATDVVMLKTKNVILTQSTLGYDSTEDPVENVEGESRSFSGFGFGDEE